MGLKGGFSDMASSAVIVDKFMKHWDGYNKSWHTRQVKTVKMRIRGKRRLEGRILRKTGKKVNLGGIKLPEAKHMDL